MITRSPTAPLTREEREVWLRAFLSVQPELLRKHDGDLNPSGFAHLCSDLAWASLDAYRKAVGGDRP